MKLLLAVVVLAGILAQQGTAQARVISSGGTQLVNIDPTIYGQNVTNRGSFLPSGAKKSWLEFETILPAGRLVEYFLYVNKITEINRNSAWIRIQIWRVGDALKYQFILVWERRVGVSLTDPNGLLYGFNVSTDGFWVHAGDRIGWTNEDDFGVISFQYIEGHRTYFRKYENSEYPRTSDTYKFDNIDLPSMFSVAVKIDDSYSRTPGPVCPTCPTAEDRTCPSPVCPTCPTAEDRTCPSLVCPTCPTAEDRTCPSIFTMVIAGGMGGLLVGIIIGIVLGYAWRRRQQNPFQTDRPTETSASGTQHTPIEMQQNIISNETGDKIPYEPLRRNTDTQPGVYASMRNSEDVGGSVYETMDDTTPPARSGAAEYAEVI